ncbi:hypothetical protein QWI17_02200 [Gilvimarinus sp. SDUM040013]|uniref:VOC domain-containing protein n=1 Tax=Gilvimarinus gilvus TaxID=3058038 RepID=A0ABU4RZA2_9GAMM|nr:hypothetical protein [Gilvimarinus sp. SDUM040013]MDO3384643.1 hypothetical protein [Gilvimarinus sp. SDUM040013]MDX6850229.1 hypothetical protein [Gilvimarinus sp. SDUM040013]
MPKQDDYEKDDMKKFHVAMSTDNIDATVDDYSARIGASPDVHVKGEYALWRTDSLNISVRQDTQCKPGELRHLGWEDNTASRFSHDKDINGVVWERFSAQQQADEINEFWPGAQYSVKAE